MGEIENQPEGEEDLLAQEAQEEAPVEGVAAEPGEPLEDQPGLLEAEPVVGVEPFDDHAGEGFPPAELSLLVALLIVVVVAWRPVKRAVAAMLDGRSERIRSELSEAQKLREEAQAALASYQRRQRDALDEAGRIIAHARTEAELIREQALKTLDQQLKRREQLALERIAQAEQAAAAEVRNAAIDVAVAAARQVLREKLDKQSGAALIDGAIEELPGRLH